jgi:hypothetical protein
MKKTGEHVKVNFGQSPFVFDIDGMMTASDLNFYNNFAVGQNRRNGFDGITTGLRILLARPGRSPVFVAVLLVPLLSFRMSSFMLVS